MHKQRLLTLAKYLRAEVNPKKFDMEYWKCGSVCCAVGHAASIPEFNKLGFTIKKQIKTSRYCAPGYKGHVSWDAIRKFFNLSDPESDYLFSSFCYRDSKILPSTVANRIEKFVKSGGETP